MEAHRCRSGSLALLYSSAVLASAFRPMMNARDLLPVKAAVIVMRAVGNFPVIPAVTMAQKKVAQR
jgi:hypothetical protein